MLLVEIIKAVLLLIHQRAVPLYSLDRYLNHLEETRMALVSLKLSTK